MACELSISRDGLGIWSCDSNLVGIMRVDNLFFNIAQYCKKDMMER